MHTLKKKRCKAPSFHPKFGTFFTHSTKNIMTPGCSRNAELMNSEIGFSWRMTRKSCTWLSFFRTTRVRCIAAIIFKQQSYVFYFLFQSLGMLHPHMVSSGGLCLGFTPVHHRIQFAWYLWYSTLYGKQSSWRFLFFQFFLNMRVRSLSVFQ